MSAKKTLLLLLLLVLAACGGSAEEVLPESPQQELSESRGQEDAALPTPLPPIDKSETVVTSDDLTLTEPVTSTQTISTTVREASSPQPVTSTKSFHCEYYSTFLGDSAESGD